MPNWCQNLLQITAKSNEDLTVILNSLFNDQGNLTLTKTSIMPAGVSDKKAWSDEYLHSLTEKEKDADSDSTELSTAYEMLDWVDDTQVGSLSKLVDEATNEEGTYAEIFFETGWQPPTVWVQRLSNLFPDTTFALNYLEPGLQFEGRKEFVNGQCLHYYENEDAITRSMWVLFYDAEDWQDKTENDDEF